MGSVIKNCEILYKMIEYYTKWWKIARNCGVYLPPARPEPLLIFLPHPHRFI